MAEKPYVAYFVAEVALSNNIPNYAGGLGVLSADMFFSAADLGVNLLGVSLLYHQNDDPEHGFRAERYMKRRDETVEVEIEDRKVKVVIWERDIVGRNGHVVPLFFLSSHTPENAPWDRDLTKHLYAGERYTRLGQEAILGVGGVRALEALGYKNIRVYHLNEGHTALAALELLRRAGYEAEAVRSKVTFTTHTPISAGHDSFDYRLAENTLRGLLPPHIRDLAGQGSLNMTEFALNLSKSVNSVSLRHKSVCENMFPGKKIKNVTNGIYLSRWVGSHIKELFFKYLPGWSEDPEVLAHAPEKIPSGALKVAKRIQENELIQWINFNKNFFLMTNVSESDYFESDTLTIGFARRFVPYKRPDLVFRNLDRLARLGERKIQFIFANRCHPNDNYCVNLREKIKEYAHALGGKVKIAMIPDYDLDIAYKLVTGCDLWLNTPIPPLEASGTSGMKAALNGALNLSTRDGWWVEGYEHEPLSGWEFGGKASYPSLGVQDQAEAEELMDALGRAVRCYHERPEEWLERMKHAIALSSFFNTHRVLREYEKNIWRL